MTVAVGTDSACDIPPEVAEELEIIIVPLHVQFGQERYQDGIDLPKGEFYDRLLHDAEYPEISMSNINDFVTVYNDLAKKTKMIISIHTGAKISGTYNMPLAAAKEVEKLPY
jgi:DegV family protein with EDD domain